MFTAEQVRAMAAEAFDRIPLAMWGEAVRCGVTKEDGQRIERHDIEQAFRRNLEQIIVERSDANAPVHH